MVFNKCMDFTKYVYKNKEYGIIKGVWITVKEFCDLANTDVRFPSQ